MGRMVKRQGVLFTQINKHELVGIKDGKRIYHISFNSDMDLSLAQIIELSEIFRR